jgi:beta-glucosidase
LPVWITENGTCDAKDAFRSSYIYEHLKRIALHLPFVDRYYHWTFIDNFEWSEGETAPFGLVRNDFSTQQRSIRESGRFYSEIITEKGVSSDMIKRYLSGI